MKELEKGPGKIFITSYKHQSQSSISRSRHFLAGRKINLQKRISVKKKQAPILQSRNLTKSSSRLSSHQRVRLFRSAPLPPLSPLNDSPQQFHSLGGQFANYSASGWKAGKPIELIIAGRHLSRRNTSFWETVKLTRKGRNNYREKEARGGHDAAASRHTIENSTTLADRAATVSTLIFQGRNRTPHGFSSRGRKPTCAPTDHVVAIETLRVLKLAARQTPLFITFVARATCYRTWQIFFRVNCKSPQRPSSLRAEARHLETLWILLLRPVVRGIR